MTIPDVATFRKLASAGQAGNTPRIWHSLVDFNNDASSRYAFVSSHTFDSFRIYSVWRDDLTRMVWDAIHKHKCILKHPSRPVSAHIDDLFAMESPDPAWQASRDCFQFDWVPDDRYLIWDISNQPWGAQKRAGLYRTSEGAEAMMVLRHYLGDYFEDLVDIDAKFTGAIVEATFFGKPVGIYNRPLLIWEVRHY